MNDRRFRKPLRYKGHDYRAPCSAHITVCTHRRQQLFGEVSAEGLILSEAGALVETALQRLHEPDKGVFIDAYVIMPDHLHAIIHLGTDPVAIPDCSISDLVRIFKLRVVRSWPRGVRERGWPPYDTHLWQESFNDVLIRNERHLETTREYILANPARWIERLQDKNLS